MLGEIHSPLVYLSNKNMIDIKKLNYEVDKIKERNARVEIDKAWETSLTRKLLILVLTYFVVVIFFFVNKLL